MCRGLPQTKNPASGQETGFERTDVQGIGRSDLAPGKRPEFGIAERFDFLKPSSVRRPRRPAHAGSRARGRAEEWIAIRAAARNSGCESGNASPWLYDSDRRFLSVTSELPPAYLWKEGVWGSSPGYSAPSGSMQCLKVSGRDRVPGGVERESCRKSVS
jgi:hypothetical protein